jgi:hypothetical protein
MAEKKVRRSYAPTRPARRIQIVVYVDDAEHTRISDLARARDMSVSQYGRRRMLSDDEDARKT